MLKLNRAIKGNPSLIIAIMVMAIAIICLIVLMSGLFQTAKNQNNEESIKNMTHQQLPKSVIVKLDQIKQKKSFTITKWEIDEQRKNLILYEVYMDEDQINELQGRKIDGWSITVLNDTEYLTEKRAAFAELMKLEKDPELQIAGFDMSAKDVNMWVYNLTPENQALDGKVIHGRTIHIYIALTPTPTAIKG